MASDTGEPGVQPLPLPLPPPPPPPRAPPYREYPPSWERRAEETGAVGGPHAPGSDARGARRLIDTPGGGGGRPAWFDPPADDTRGVCRGESAQPIAAGMGSEAPSNAIGEPWSQKGKTSSAASPSGCERACVVSAGMEEKTWAREISRRREKSLVPGWRHTTHRGGRQLGGEAVVRRVAGCGQARDVEEGGDGVKHRSAAAPRQPRPAGGRQRAAAAGGRLGGEKQLQHGHGGGVAGLAGRRVRLHAPALVLLEHGDADHLQLGGAEGRVRAAGRRRGPRNGGGAGPHSAGTSAARQVPRAPGRAEDKTCAAPGR